MNQLMDNSPAFSSITEKLGDKGAFHTRATSSIFPRYTMAGQQLINQIIQSASAQLENPEADFKPLADRARSQFRTKTMPALAERLGGMGQGATLSSDYSGLMADAEKDFEQDLLAQQSQFGMQNKALLLQLLGLGLQPSFDTQYTERGGNMWGSAVGKFAEGLGMAAGGGGGAASKLIGKLF